MFCGTESIMRNIPYIQHTYEEYSTKYCQSHKTLLWIWIMLWCMSNLDIHYLLLSRCSKVNNAKPFCFVACTRHLWLRAKHSLLFLNLLHCERKINDTEYALFIFMSHDTLFWIQDFVFGCGGHLYTVHIWYWLQISVDHTNFKIMNASRLVWVPHKSLIFEHCTLEFK